MRGEDFLEGISEEEEDFDIEPNVSGDFDCFECREPVSEAWHDKVSNVLYWWCSQGHQSQMKGFNI